MPHRRPITILRRSLQVFRPGTHCGCTACRHEKALHLADQLERERAFEIEKQAAISQLTAEVAHKFNNLLMTILGSLDLAKHYLDGEDERVSRNLLRAEAAAIRGKVEVQTLLDRIGYQVRIMAFMQSAAEKPADDSK